MKDTRRTKFGKIDLNKVTKSFMNIDATKKAEEIRQELNDRLKRCEKRLNSVEEESEEWFKRQEAYSEAYEDVEFLDADPHLSLESFDIAQKEIHRLLAGLAALYLDMSPYYGIKAIVKAYRESYQQKSICPQCGKGFTQTNKGRTKKYCSDSCKQKAYRQRKKKEDNDKDKGPVTADY